MDLYNLNEVYTFNPKRTDDLRPECLPYIGKKVTVKSRHENYEKPGYKVGFIKEFSLDIPEDDID